MRKPQLLRVAVAILILTVTALAANTALATRSSTTPVKVQQQTYQGKPIRWWANRAVIARKDANRQLLVLRHLRLTLEHNPTIQESVKLATTVYPALTESRAWCIIERESGGNVYAKNRNSTATGLYQFLTSTFASTPFRNFSIYSAYAQSLAAGWMHQNGRGREWSWSCR